MIDKPERKNWIEMERCYPFMSIIFNCYLVLSAFLFLGHLIAPLLGGKLLLNALVIYGSWIGMALTMKFFLKKLKRKIKLKKYEFLLICSYGVICSFLWFLYPFNIVFSIFIVVGNVSGYKAQQKSS